MSEYVFSTQDDWYAVQTKPHREDKAASNIRRLGVQVLLPKIKSEKYLHGTRRITVKPLFPGYLFARFRPSAHLSSIRYARGVNRVLCTGLVPIPLGDEVVGAIEERVGADGLLQISSTSLRKGDPVVVTEGPLQGLSGVFERELSDGERAVILLKTVEYQARLLIEKMRLKPQAELD
jgi:transcriptional antiterminator RfaH